MGQNAQKVPFARSLQETAQRRVLDRLQIEGKELPCSIVSVTGWIVTVKFELKADPFTLPQITVPVFNSLYDYIPLQKGDLGVVMSIDTYLGGISGLGGGVAQLGVVPNLTALGFVPCGNKNFPAPSDPNKRIIQGPKGAIMQTLDGMVQVIVDKDTGDVTVNAKSGSKINLNGELWINGKKYLNHEHSGVQTGSGDSGGVVDP
jgi:hypothetical protein